MADQQGENLKTVLSAFLFFALTGNAFAACRCPDTESLRTSWKSFRAAALTGKPESVEKFYKFPLVILSPMEGERPMKIPRSVFKKNYEKLFVKDDANLESDMYAALKKADGNEYIRPIQFSVERCALQGAVRIADYNFDYDQKRGWFIKSMYYGEGFQWIKARLEP
jgi:hypothetical protein